MPTTTEKVLVHMIFVFFSFTHNAHPSGIGQNDFLARLTECLHFASLPAFAYIHIGQSYRKTSLFLPGTSLIIGPTSRKYSLPYVLERGFEA